MSTLLLWLKIFYTTIGQYPTLYDFLAITPEDIAHLNYYLTYPNKCVKLKIFQPTLLPPLVYSGRCHITCVIQVNLMRRLSYCQDDKSVHMSVT